MELDDLRRNWDALGRDDPLWAVLTYADKRHGRWDAEEFMRTGQAELVRYLDHLGRAGFAPPRGRALDFGCGPGRIAQAMAAHFDAVDGIDIAASMIDLADQWNRHPDRCRYHVNAAPDLSLFEDASFDLVFSFQVLQHIEPGLQLGYVREFGRILAPGGVAFFQVVTAEKVGATGPLPEDAFRAEITVTEPIGSVPAGARAGVPLRVANPTSTTWPQIGDHGWYCVTVANRWVAADGNVAVADDGRAYLPDDVAPGATAEVVLEVQAPDTPGDYVLEVDLVQEGVAWFHTKGSAPARVAVTVTPATGRAVEDGAPLAPRMEMHVVTMEQVAAALAPTGVVVRRAEPLIGIIGGTERDFERTFVIATR